MSGQSVHRVVLQLRYGGGHRPVQQLGLELKGRRGDKGLRGVMCVKITFFIFQVAWLHFIRSLQLKWIVRQRTVIVLEDLLIY